MGIREEGSCHYTEMEGSFKDSRHSFLSKEVNKHEPPPLACRGVCVWRGWGVIALEPLLAEATANYRWFFGKVTL